MGVGGNGNVRGLRAACGGYNVAFSNNDFIVYTSVVSRFGGVGGRAGTSRWFASVGGTCRIPYEGFRSRNNPFRTLHDGSARGNM
jgi:hypothetical protein